MSEEKRKVTHEGILPLGGVEIPCFVLEDGTRVLSSRAFQEALRIRDKPTEGGKRGGHILPIFLSATAIKPFIDKQEGLANFEPIICYRGKQLMHGYEASALADVCDAILEARKQGAKFTARQSIVADQCEILMRAFAKVGIIALVDEVTGYQDVRVKDALERIFNKFLLEEAKKYVVTYPIELYKQWFRLNNWDWKPENAQKRPGVIGTWTNDLIYKRIAPSLLEQLEIKNPKNAKGYREHKHFQFLTDEVGEPRLREFFGGLIALARATTSWRKYMEMVNRAYPKFGDQLTMALESGGDKE